MNYKILPFIDEYKRLENELIRIEKLDKSNFTLDQHETMLDKYNQVWKRINKINKLTN